MSYISTLMLLKITPLPLDLTDKDGHISTIGAYLIAAVESTGKRSMISISQFSCAQKPLRHIKTGRSVGSLCKNMGWRRMIM